MKLGPGEQVRDNLKLLRLIGVGGMGSVWAAQHTGLRAEVAVKFVSAELAASDPALVDRFQREASAAAQIKSPHVVQIYDVGVTDEGSPYIVMELLEGQSLGDWLQHRRLTLRQAGQVVVQVAKALDRAHQAGIVHRDIKPDNIFLSTSDDGRICKVLDFGIAKQADLPAVSGLTAPGMLIGTPEFMSPEAIDEPDKVDGHLDLWALAVVTYLAITGELPLWAEGIGKLCALICTATAAPASRHRDDVPPGIDAWFARAFAKDKNARFQTAREMAAAFIRALPARRDDDVFSSGAFSTAPEAGEDRENVAIPRPPKVPRPAPREKAGATDRPDAEHDAHTAPTPVPTSSPVPGSFPSGGWSRFSSDAPGSEPAESLATPDSLDELDEGDRVTWDGSNWAHISSAMVESTAGLKVGAEPATRAPVLPAEPAARGTPSGAVPALVDVAATRGTTGRTTAAIALVAAFVSLGLGAALFLTRGSDRALPEDPALGSGTETHGVSPVASASPLTPVALASAPVSARALGSAEPATSQLASAQPSGPRPGTQPAWPTPATTAHGAPPSKPKAGPTPTPPKKREDFGF